MGCCQKKQVEPERGANSSTTNMVGAQIPGQPLKPGSEVHPSPEKEPLRPGQVELQKAETPKPSVNPADEAARQQKAQKEQQEAEALRQKALEQKKAEQEAADKKAQAEQQAAKAKADADRKAKEEAGRLAKEEADKKAKAEADRKAKEEADHKAKEEADKLAKAQAEKKAKEAAEAKEKELAAQKKAKEEADRKAQEEADTKAKDLAEKQAKELAEKKAREEAEQKAKEEEAKKAAQQSKLPFSLKKVLDAFNDIRVNPKKYAEVIQTRYINDLDKSGVLKSKRIKTNEGLPVFKEAKAFLEKAKGVPALQLDYGLVAAAYLHSDWMSETDNLDHTGKNGSNVKKRMEEFGKVDQYGMQGGAENILFTYSYDPVEFILDFVIDDGVPSRGHRKNIFQDTATTVGFGIRPPGERKHRRWYFTIDIGWPSYKSDKSLINAKVMQDSGLKDYEIEAGS